MAQELSKFVVKEADEAAEVEGVQPAEASEGAATTPAVEPAADVPAHEGEGDDEAHAAGAEAQPEADAEPVGVPSVADEAPTRSRGPVVLVGILLILLAVAGLALWGQSERVSALESEVGALERQLGGARLEVARHRSTMDQVRAEVSDLLLRLEGLSALVSESPGAPKASPQVD